MRGARAVVASQSGTGPTAFLPCLFCTCLALFTHYHTGRAEAGQASAHCGLVALGLSVRTHPVRTFSRLSHPPSAKSRYYALLCTTAATTAATTTSSTVQCLCAARNQYSHTQRQYSTALDVRAQFSILFPLSLCTASSQRLITTRIIGRPPHRRRRPQHSLLLLSDIYPLGRAPRRARPLLPSSCLRRSTAHETPVCPPPPVAHLPDAR